jgi:hypothetical protein
MAGLKAWKLRDEWSHAGCHGHHWSFQDSALGFERRCGILAPGRFADIAILRSSGRYEDPSEAVLAPAMQIAATLRRGRVIAGTLP